MGPLFFLALSFIFLRYCAAPPNQKLIAHFGRSGSGGGVVTGTVPHCAVLSSFVATMRKVSRAAAGGASLQGGHFKRINTYLGKKGFFRAFRTFQDCSFSFKMCRLGRRFCLINTEEASIFVMVHYFCKYEQFSLEGVVIESNYPNSRVWKGI